MNMTKTNWVTVKEFNPIGNDLKGATASFSLPRKQADFIFLERKADTISGNTYHEGKNEGTSPKTFILISGDIEFNYRAVNEEEKTSMHISAPAVIEVNPMVIHSVRAITDILILECNSISDIQNDRIRENV